MWRSPPDEGSSADSMRSVFLVTYDIREDKRLKAVFKAMCGFGDHLQYSVFRCELSPANKVLMKGALTEIIDHRVDQVLIFDLGPVDGVRADMVESLGEVYVPGEHDAVVV
jgi:CRISPR-associated protein Cas2